MLDVNSQKLFSSYPAREPVLIVDIYLYFYGFSIKSNYFGLDLVLTL